MFRAPLCPSSGAQELYRWLLPVVLGALVYRSLVWCGAVGCVSGLRDVIRSSRVIQMVAACGNLRLGLQVVGLMSCGLCVRLVWCGIVGYMSGLRDVSRETSRKPDT